MKMLGELTKQCETTWCRAASKSWEANV